MPEEIPDPTGPENFEDPPLFFPRELTGEPYTPSSELIEVSVEAVYAREEGKDVEHFVVVHDSYRRLPIMIDPCNARAIATAIEQAVPDRPMTHDLLKAAIDRLGGEVVRVVIDDLWSTTYYARVVLLQNDQELEIDARPSDAIALAVRCGATILVSDSILDKARD